MKTGLSNVAPLVPGIGRSWVLIAAYDVSTGDSSEGHVAFNILRRLCKTYRIVLVTRRNNKVRLECDPIFAAACPGVHLVGYDLPKWAGWWKRGARFYQAYAYLWQMTWPQILRDHKRLSESMRLIHVLNFHNDSIPSLAWQTGLPVIWGPINHNEIVATWRRTFWPLSIGMRHVAAFALRRILWRFDPFLKSHIRNSRVVLSAGEWVDRRLNLSVANRAIRRSQLGVSENAFYIGSETATVRTGDARELICAGRLDWIKGLDLAIEALSLLPDKYCLRIVGKGPAESSLRALATRLGVTTRVTFQPSVPRSALPAIYAQADLFLFTSAEVGGLVWVEALASGLPVVAFDGDTEVAAAARHLPGIHLAVAGRGRRENVERFADAIKTAADVPRNPAVLRTAALQQYGWDRLAATIREAYCLAIGANR